MEHENNEPTQQPPEEMRQLWQERYGDMVPEKIIDTKIGADGKRYYKVQWAATTMEPGKNFLEAELLIKKYWDPVEKKLRFPLREKENEDGEEGASSSRQCDDGFDDESNETTPQNDDVVLNVKYEHFERRKENNSGSSSDLDFAVANITDEKENEANKTKDIIDKTSNIENSDSTTITKCTEENTKIKEKDEEENSLKRKRSYSVETIGVISSEISKSNVSTEVATKKAKDDNGD